MFFYVFFEKSIISRLPFQLYTKLNYLEFKIPKICGGSPKSIGGSPKSGLTKSLPALSRASPSIRASPDSDPQLLKHGCALAWFGSVAGFPKVDATDTRRLTIYRHWCNPTMQSTWSGISESILRFSSHGESTCGSSGQDLLLPSSSSAIDIKDVVWHVTSPQDLFPP